MTKQKYALKLADRLLSKASKKNRLTDMEKSTIVETNKNRKYKKERTNEKY